MKLIDKQLLDDVSRQAKQSDRLRMNYKFHQSLEDKCHRMLNAIEPGSPLPIHRHKYTSETVVCLCGRFVEEFYDELERICTDAIELTPIGPNSLAIVLVGQWHILQTLMSGSERMKCKEGKN